MSLFRRPKAAITYQDVWGSDGDWSDPDRYSVQSALELSTVLACTRIRANTFAQIPLTSYRLDAAGYSVEVSPQPRLIASPSRSVSTSTWKRQMSISRDLFGYAAGFIAGRDAALYPTTVEWMPPDKLQWVQDSYMSPVRWFLAGQPIATDDVLVIPSGVVMPGCPVGIAPLERAGLVELATRARDFGADWFRNGAPPSVVVSSDTELTQEQSEGISDRISARWKKRKPAVIGSGLSVSYNEIKANESQFLETMRHVQVDICHALGVPPEKLGLSASTSSGGSMTYANREQQTQQFLVDEINADLVLIQESLTAALPRPQFVRGNTGALLRSDIVARFDAYKTGIEAGVMFPNEARALEDWKPYPGGDAPNNPGSAP